MSSPKPPAVVRPIFPTRDEPAVMATPAVTLFWLEFMASVFWAPSCLAGDGVVLFALLVHSAASVTGLV